LLLIALVLQVLVGCAPAGPPVSLDQLPLPAGFAPYEGAYEVTFDTLISTYERAFGVQRRKYEIGFYWRAEALDWEQIMQFYREALAEQGWTEKAQADIFTAHWVRRSTAGRQTLVIGRVPIPDGEGGYWDILVLILAS